MSFNKESATARAKTDLADRANIDVSEITTISAEEKDFPDMSLGAPVSGEMSAQMISSGWEIVLSDGHKNWEYRADKYQLRLVNHRGTNQIVVS